MQRNLLGLLLTLALPPYTRKVRLEVHAPAVKPRLSVLRMMVTSQPTSEVHRIDQKTTPITEQTSVCTVPIPTVRP